MAELYPRMDVFGYGPHNIAVVGPEEDADKYKKKGYVVVRKSSDGHLIELLGHASKRLCDGILGAVVRARAAAANSK